MTETCTGEKSSRFGALHLSNLWRGFAVWLLLALTIPMPTVAQEAAAWDPVTERSLIKQAESVIDGGVIDIEDLKQLRSKLAELRAQVSEAAARQSVASLGIEARIDALGPAPGPDATEPEAIAERRKELENQLALVDAPKRDARETLAQLELIIREIDRELRKAQLSLLLLRIPSVLQPGTISTGIKDVQGSTLNFASGEPKPLNEQDGSSSPLYSLLLLLFGLGILGLVHPRLSRWLDERVETGAGRHWGKWVALAAIGNLLVPFIGVGAFILVPITMGLRLEEELFAGELASYILLALISGYWMGITYFAPRAPSRRMVEVDDAHAKVGVRLSLALSALIAVSIITDVFDAETQLSDEVIALISTPTILLTSVVLWWLSTLLRSRLSAPTELPAEKAQGKISGRSFTRALGVFLKVAAISSAALVLLGYINLAQQISAATALSLAILALAFLVHTFLVGAIRFFVGLGLGGNDMAFPLMPVLVGVFVAFLSTPLLALSWGLRVEELQELWRIAINGVEVSGVRISFLVIVSFLLVFLVGAVATRWVQYVLGDTILPRTKLGLGSQSAMVTGVGYFGMTFSLLIALATAGVSMSNIAVIAGALSLGIGFGLQTIVSNFISGIILLFERPIGVGDWIEVSGHSGTVKKISVRSTQIQTFDKHEVIVPNQDLIGNTVKNMTLSSRTGRLILPIGVGFDSDLETTKSILERAAKENPDLLKHPPAVVLFRGIGADALNFELRCFLREIENIYVVQSDLLFRIFSDLKKAGIEIPFPQRVVHLQPDTADKEEQLGKDTPARSNPREPKEV